MEKFNIAILEINTDQITKQSVKLKRDIDALKASQAELRKEGKTSSVQFIENEQSLKTLGKAYRDNQQLAVSLNEANADLDKTMQVQGKSTQELRESRRNLNQISKQLARSTGELTGSLEGDLALRDKINGVIDEQTEAIRDQSSAFNGAKDGIGEYANGIETAFAGLLGFYSVHRKRAGLLI